MAKKKRRAFPGETARPETRRNVDSSSSPHQVINADEPSFGIFGWFRNAGTRETIESIIIAVLLAFMFKTYEAEAFVIPTGSMAPSLQGQHMDLDCDQCGYRYVTGASMESSSDAKIVSTFCPICNYRTSMRRKSRRVKQNDGTFDFVEADAEHRSNSGDRILVNKFVYDFKEPERYDVIVFKYPNNAKQNYIKRLIGLPGDNILIENGDIYLMHLEGDQWQRSISRKPSSKLKQVLIDVDDTNHIGDMLLNVGWPSRWAQWDGGKQWGRVSTDDKQVWSVVKTNDEAWMRYRHLVPNYELPSRLTNRKSQWEMISAGQLPLEMNKPLSELPAGRLITDTLAYNEGIYSGVRNRGIPGVGYHWVGDIGVEAWCTIGSGDGELMLDLVEGGVHFTCRFDASTGKATLHASDSSIQFQSDDGKPIETPTAGAGVTRGDHHLLFVNADDQIHLWVDGRFVDFDASKYVRSRMPIPKYSPEDPGDAEPAGIGAIGLEVTVDRLKIVRDIYYSSVKLEDDGANNNSNETKIEPLELEELFQTPEKWADDMAIKVFETKRDIQKPMFQLEKFPDNPAKDQFFPMGDNSTSSLDARVWPGPDHFVERDMLIGRAIFVYWPHTLNEPIPHFPNFGKMKFIR